MEDLELVEVEGHEADVEAAEHAAEAEEREKDEDSRPGGQQALRGHDRVPVVVALVGEEALGVVQLRLEFCVEGVELLHADGVGAG